MKAKTVLKMAGVLVGLPIAALLVLLVLTFTGRSAIPDLLTVNGISVIKDGFVTVGVIPVGDGEVALIDAGNDKSGKVIIDELTRKKLGIDSVKAIFLTHGHHDHTAAAGLFPKAEILALEADVGLAEGRAGSHGPLTRMMPVRPTGIKVTAALKDGDTVTAGNTQVHVYALPGHTAGSAAYLVNGVLFIGDSADAGKDGKIAGSPWLFSDNTALNRDSLKALYRVLVQENARVDAIVFSHSGALVDGIAPLAEYSKRN